MSPFLRLVPGLVALLALHQPAIADDADLKQQMDRASTAFMESFNKQDAASIAANFATNAIAVNPSGLHTNVAQYYESIFKSGTYREETTVDQVWLLGPDTAIGTGKFRLTGKNQSGAPVDVAGFWTATYVKEDGKWKVRMLTGVPKPPLSK
jgi:ketosteroid isomerase-like protein